ncbi:SurA N-terminal domain-containing protein [bacterium]|nr:SurA N-terminal domain-containing protein [bacterium]
MMNYLRKNVKTILWFVASIFIIAIFAGFGGAFFLQRQSGLIGKVNGVGLPLKDFSQLFDQAIEFHRQNKKTAQIDINALKKELLQNMIKEELMYQESKKYNITITQQELINAIRSYPIFQKDGKFDISLYLRILRYLHTTPEAFETARKKSLAVFKLQTFFLSAIKITTKELEYTYNKEKQEYPDNFKKGKEEFKEFFLMKKQSSIFDTWMEKLICDANIKIYMEDTEKIFEK